MSETLIATIHVCRYRAEWLLTSGRSPLSDLAVGDAAAEKLYAVAQGAADTAFERGALALVRARATKDPVARRTVAIRARTELAAAVKENVFLERDAKSLLTEAEALVR